jgi:hypothetical protein
MEQSTPIRRTVLLVAPLGSRPVGTTRRGQPDSQSGEPRRRQPAAVLTVSRPSPGSERELAASRIGPSTACCWAAHPGRANDVCLTASSADSSPSTCPNPFATGCGRPGNRTVSGTVQSAGAGRSAITATGSACATAEGGQQQFGCAHAVPDVVQPVRRGGSGDAGGPDRTVLRDDSGGTSICVRRTREGIDGSQR